MDEATWRGLEKNSPFSEAEAWLYLEIFGEKPYRRLAEEWGWRRSRADAFLKLFRSKTGHVSGQKPVIGKPVSQKVKPSKPVKIRSENRSKSGQENAIIYPFESEAFILIWEAWKRYLEGWKKTYRPESEQAALKKLSVFSEAEAIHHIEHSISNGWKGIYPDKDYKTQNGKTEQYSRLEAIADAMYPKKKHD
jgi:hypothetical protein